jgi:ribosome-binding factor A
MHYRKQRLEEQIRRLVSELLIRDIKDPRIGFITITGVEISQDYAHARIGVSMLGDAREMRKSLEGLESARGYMQSRVGKAMRLRHTPRFEFYADPSVAEGVRMVELLSDLEKRESKDDPDTDKGDDGE